MLRAFELASVDGRNANQAGGKPGNRSQYRLRTSSREHHVSGDQRLNGTGPCGGVNQCTVREAFIRYLPDTTLLSSDVSSYAHKLPVLDARAADDALEQGAGALTVVVDLVRGDDVKRVDGVAGEPRTAVEGAVEQLLHLAPDAQFEAHEIGRGDDDERVVGRGPVLHEAPLGRGIRLATVTGTHEGGDGVGGKFAQCQLRPSVFIVLRPEDALDGEVVFVTLLRACGTLRGAPYHGELDGHRVSAVGPFEVVAVEGHRAMGLE
jgi:hypothetical protein